MCYKITLDANKCNPVIQFIVYYGLAVAKGEEKIIRSDSSKPNPGGDHSTGFVQAKPRKRSFDLIRPSQTQEEIIRSDSSKPNPGRDHSIGFVQAKPRKRSFDQIRPSQTQEEIIRPDSSKPNPGGDNST